MIFDVELPDGAAHGPVIDRLELARLRLVSGPKFRAYIAAHSVAWRPGVTRRRHPRNRSVHLWSSDPGRQAGLADRSEGRGAPDQGRRLTGEPEAQPLGVEVADLIIERYGEDAWGRAPLVRWLKTFEAVRDPPPRWRVPREP